MASGTGPLSPDFTGIDPDLMQGFVTALERGRDVIGEQSERIRQLLATAQLSAADLQPIKEIEGWIDDELPGLRKRNETIRAGDDLAPWLPGSGMVGYSEGRHLSPAEAQRQGTALGRRFLDIEPVEVPWLGRPSSDEYGQIVKELAAHKNDADFTAAFFAALGTEGTIGLPALLRKNLDSSHPRPLAATPDPDDEVLRMVSQAFGTAVTAGSRVPGFVKIKDAIRNAGPKAGLLLSGGKFPAEWLTDVVLKQGLADPKKIGSGFLYALGNNPAAARQAIAAVTGPYAKDQSKLKEFLKKFNDSADAKYAGSDSNADAFGRMLAAASGAYDEDDGKHSKESAAFAFTVMTTMDDLKLGEGIRVHLAEIAGAYATEITEGANIGDANMTEDSVLKPSTSAFGMRSAFTLSPEDTYRFLKLFADSAENLAPFDEGMGRFSQKLIADASATTRRTGDVKRLDQVFTALGNVRGFERAAIEKVQGNLDMIDKQRKDVVNFTRDTAIGLTSIFAAPTLAYDFAWLALSTSLSAEGAFGEEDETRMDRADKADGIETLGRQHAYAQILMANGFAPKVTPAEFQAACPPGVAVADAHGNLKPFSELIKQRNKGLEAFEKWIVANGMDSKDELSLGNLSGAMADRFESRNKRGKERGLAFDS
ncbi:MULTISPECIES: DUF6571 family protein [Streptosporangium]|uniref:DUF6571 domain-containing protein n=1 Tax=Streptosporangium brasiliense TaxID=47480 RepID=A0ABT9R8Z9_9ACTN|nr:DUF6571 family protein [Streptosporangium brasiliense]MDP9865711.1 hypothetical protein [Streptosporangium brasiliense]